MIKGKAISDFFLGQPQTCEKLTKQMSCAQLNARQSELNGAIDRLVRLDVEKKRHRETIGSVELRQHLAHILFLYSEYLREYERTYEGLANGVGVLMSGSARIKPLVRFTEGTSQSLQRVSKLADVVSADGTQLVVDGAKKLNASISGAGHITAMGELANGIIDFCQQVKHSFSTCRDVITVMTALAAPEALATAAFTKGCVSLGGELAAFASTIAKHHSCTWMSFVEKEPERAARLMRQLVGMTSQARQQLRQCQQLRTEFAAHMPAMIDLQADTGWSRR